MNEYQQRNYEAKKALVSTLNTFDSGYKFELLENKEEPDRSEIVLTGLIPVYVNYQEYQKEYYFFLRHNLPYVRYETEKTVKNRVGKEPNNVFKLHANKIKNWVDYLIKVYEELVKISKERVEKITEFQEEVIALGGKIGSSDPYGVFSGSIFKNGIEFNFTVHDEGYISKNIEIHYAVDDSLDSFVKLSDNKY